MKKAIICHGISKSKEFVAEFDLPVTTWHWLGWLQQKYNLADVNCQNVLFPHSWFGEKNFKDDAEAFANFQIDEDTRLIGWSAGTSFLLKHLFLHPEICGRHLVLLSPHLNMNGILGDYFNGEIPMDLMERFGRVDMFYSTDDPVPGVVESAEKLMALFPDINVHKFEHHGHFQLQTMGTREFPELWEVCKSEI
jgi:pimeloyl-ACP methyl ester carboxylesterase